jgi:hypothetical protein
VRRRLEARSATPQQAARRCPHTQMCGSNIARTVGVLAT